MISIRRHAVWKGLSERVVIFGFVSFLTDVDSKFGAMLFLYSGNGERNIVELGGPILPVFTKL